MQKTSITKYGKNMENVSKLKSLSWGLQWNIKEIKGRVSSLINESIMFDDLSVSYCSDTFMIDYCLQKYNENVDYNKWYIKNKNNLLLKKDKIDNLVSLWVLKDNTPETIWKYTLDEINNQKNNFDKIKNNIILNFDKIKNNVSKKIWKYISNWSPWKVIINFTINEKADYCVSWNEITIDLWRLIKSENVIEEITKWLTHELFHVWMNEWKIHSEFDNNKTKIKKFAVIYRIINEWLAVFIAEQNLIKHHENQWKNYENLKKISFDKLNNLFVNLKLDENTIIEKVFYEDMWYFYVVWLEIVKKIFENIWLEKFQILIKESRSNPELMIVEYNKYSKLNIINL